MFGSIYAVVTGRSSKWPALRNAFIRENPNCVVCGQDADTVHHLKPFHVAPELELDRNNLASVCDKCHLTVAHLNQWRLWNERFWTVVEWMNKGRRGDKPATLDMPPPVCGGVESCEDDE